MAALCVLVDEEESAWRGGLGKFDSQEGGVYGSAHFPPLGFVLGARGKGVSEEGGRRKRVESSQSEESRRMSMRKVRTML